MKDKYIKSVNKKIELVLTDVDGCMTNNLVFYTPNHEKIKGFNMQDGMGVKRLHEHGIITGIITGDASDATKHRAEDLKMDIIRINVKDKLKELYKIIEEYDIDIEKVAYMGDDIQDLSVLEVVGVSVAPNNAIEEVKEKVKYVTKKSGGNGAYREYSDYIIKLNGGVV